MGLGRFELPTSPLSGVRSNQLSYRPFETNSGYSLIRYFVRRLAPTRSTLVYSLKEVIQPHVPVRLPCYDFTLVTDHTVVNALPKVRLSTSGATNFHGVTGGVYKTRERIHRTIADIRLLAIPTSRSRVADFDPD